MVQTGNDTGFSCNNPGVLLNVLVPCIGEELTEGNQSSGMILRMGASKTSVECNTGNSIFIWKCTNIAGKYIRNSIIIHQGEAEYCIIRPG